IITPLRVGHFKFYLKSHPNCPLVESFFCGLQEGFWPFSVIVLTFLSFMMNLTIALYKHLRKRLSYTPSIIKKLLWVVSHSSYHHPLKTFQGDVIIVQHLFARGLDPHLIFTHYLQSHDELFPFHHLLWLCTDGTLPSCSFVLSFLHHFAGSSFSGHSLQLGGATALAEYGVPYSSIQSIGCWNSDAF
ncbi:hypothetical protein BDQ17DRAFT_1253435, partial [Cyathus striatus]